MNNIRDKKGKFIKGHSPTFQAFKEKNPMWKDGISKRIENIRGYKRKYKRKMERENPRFKLDRRFSKAIWASLKGKKQFRKWKELVEYTIEDLMAHLEKQFDDKMNWNNYGSYWVVDHIKPKSLFKEEEFKECWDLENLQPLEKEENRKKSNHWLESKEVWDK